MVFNSLSKRPFILALVATAAVVGVFFVLNNYLEYGSEDDAVAMRFATHANSRLGISFQYREEPDGYVLDTPPLMNTDTLFQQPVILMLRSELEQLQSGAAQEAPPTIQILLFKNPERLPSAEWATQNDFSGYAQIRGDATTYSFLGTEALRFTSDGLYLIDTVIVPVGDRMYVFKGEYLTEDSLIRQDFLSLLETVTLLPDASQDAL